jgi:hypothetical protein
MYPLTWTSQTTIAEQRASDLLAEAAANRLIREARQGAVDTRLGAGLSGVRRRISRPLGPGQRRHHPTGRPPNQTARAPEATLLESDNPAPAAAPTRRQHGPAQQFTFRTPSGEDPVTSNWKLVRTSSGRCFDKAYWGNVVQWDCWSPWWQQWLTNAVQV